MSESPSAAPQQQKKEEGTRVVDTQYDRPLATASEAGAGFGQTYVNEHAVVRRQHAAGTAPFVVTGFAVRPSYTATLYCDSAGDAMALIELLLNCGFVAASYAPNAHRGVTP